MNDSQTTAAVQRYLDDLAGVGSDTASEAVIRALLGRSVDRLHALCAGVLFRRYPRLLNGPANVQTHELLSAVVERLIKAMRHVRPPSVKHFFALANQHMRWELNELTRQLDQRKESLELTDSFAGKEVSPTEEGEPTIAVKRILQAIERLPEVEREIFSLVRIQGMTQAGAADVLDISVKTAQRRLSRALAMLIEELPGMQPVADQRNDEGLGKAYVDDT